MMMCLSYRNTAISHARFAEARFTVRYLFAKFFHFFRFLALVHASRSIRR